MPWQFDEYKDLCAKRVHRIFGRRVSGGFYVREATPECFELLELKSRYIQTPNGNWKRVPKNQWTYHIIARIYDKHIEIPKIDDEHARSRRNNIYSKLFGLKYYTPNSLAYKGFLWVSQGKDIVAEMPIKLDYAGNFLEYPVRKARHLDSEKLKELHKLVANVRMHLVVRHKTGALNALAEEYLIPDASRYMYKPNQEFLEILKSIDQENIESFGPLLQCLYIGWQPLQKFKRTQNIRKRFDTVVGNYREQLYERLNIVDYRPEA